MNSEDDIALRVVQLDVKELDDSVEEILSTQVNKCFKYDFFGRNILEIVLNPLIQGLNLYYTLWTAKVSVGQAILGVKYVETSGLEASARKIRILTVLRFVQTLLAKHSSKFNNSKFQKLEKLSQFLFLCNWLMFIYRGIFPTIALRILGLKTVYAEKNTQREITFQTLGREILMYAAANSLVHFISFLNVRKVVNRIKGAIFQPPDQTDSCNAKECAICKKLPIYPCISICKCLIFCHYCVQVKLLSEGTFKCFNCSEIVLEAESLPMQSNEIVAEKTD
uniref:RING-type E3 ubiquitin transferase (cysteine targeting) n=1 Tax=Phallusia mammillata TaxID=59560 RepID=A0A6F9DNS5_9ASCI|nr:peroxisome biogenesis factor 2-like [Phallusia mammillata]